MRYFQNKMPDYVSGRDVDVSRQKWLPIIHSMVEQINRHTPEDDFQSAEGGLYVGSAGVAYMLYYLTESGLFVGHRREFFEKATACIAVSIGYSHRHRSRDPPVSFILGSAGVYVVGALLHKAMGDQQKAGDFVGKYADLALHCVPLNFLSCGSDELFVGRAGYLCGALTLHSKFGPVIPKEALHAVWKSIIQSGREYAKKRKLKCPLMYAYYETEYLGAAHGLCSILQMLLSFPEFVKSDEAAAQDIKNSVDFLLSIKQPNGNYATAMDEVNGSYQRPESEELVHWCHGAPGVVYLMAKAYLTWREDKYFQACIDCGELTWQKGLLRKGPGICHGVAGSGYVFLLLYRLTEDLKYIYRAEKFAEFLISEEFTQKANTPDTPYSLYEGLAGTVCFLTDLLLPQHAEFPFFDVFSNYE
ncbi:lanC-like protein 3 [Lingula anatina]|uniref:LanC-like protein 3 n=1 Tax=Lingula anatina TaxID=7574 RepID=A0A1S3IQA6_LINAN|nr:lanC-like protein 3 [Lingula anatina]|eukprot:XP_013400405.1 lanC-like protein 3 [Lingula anatina]